MGAISRKSERKQIPKMKCMDAVISIESSHELLSHVSSHLELKI